MKLIVPLMFSIILLAGFASSCKHNPVEPPPKCDTCKTDTTCDTCKHDTIPKVSDTTSHNFTWTQSTIPSEAGLTGCWVFGPNNVYVVGGSLHRSTDGKTWSTFAPEDADRGFSLGGDLSGCTMFAFTEDDYWLVDGSAIHVTEGSTLAKVYRDIDTGSWKGLHSGWGTSSHDMYFVGDGGTILHFDGSSWTKMPSGTTKNILSIWGTSDNNIWAAGFNSTTAESVLLNYNGSVWQTIDLAKVGAIGPGLAGLEAVWTCDSSGHHITIASGSLIWQTTDNGLWRNDSGSVPNNLGGGSFDGLYLLSGNGANDVMAAGSWGWVGHWSGLSWKRYDELYNYGTDFASYQLSVKANTACVVGDKNASSWVAIGQR
jgi:hypothetical protein